MVSVNDVTHGEEKIEDDSFRFRNDDVIILLGAGASVEAKLLASMDMTRKLEDYVSSNNPRGKWTKYKNLYKTVKSLILYGKHLTSSSVSEVCNEVNIEEFVNVLTELAKSEGHPIYPFIANWNMDLVKYGGGGFENLKKFREDIVNELTRKWVNVNEDRDCGYFKGLYRYWEETKSNLRVFTLNYDMCVERACGVEHVCRGFKPERIEVGGEKVLRKVWSDEYMDDDDAKRSAIRLYKLHGSLDWRRDRKTRVLYYEDMPDPCDDIDDYQLIFGTTYKLSYQDPFLFQISELRKYAAKARLIIAIGYGFNDDHINEILGGALTHNSDSKLISVEYATVVEDEKIKERRSSISEKLKLSESLNGKIDVRFDGAKKFLGEVLSRKFVEENLSQKGDSPF